ncbi:amidohydrolase family protein [Mycobacterium deserti]|uniref:amidohydrolase family protein n=1 Tax=Mycobacterium deserti TaxID=2978347 RepID=UPI0028CFECB6|nr:amidohydrolase family protein [Mycobacterium deserti]
MTSRANDQAADASAARPARFGAFAALPLSDAAAVHELRCAVAGLGCKGARANGRENGRFLDDPALFPTWRPQRRVGHRRRSVHLRAARPADGVLDIDRLFSVDSRAESPDELATQPPQRRDAVHLTPVPNCTVTTREKEIDS